MSSTPPVVLIMAAGLGTRMVQQPVHVIELDAELQVLLDEAELEEIQGAAQDGR